MRLHVQGGSEFSGLELGTGEVSWEESPGALGLLLVVLGVTREAGFLRGPDSLGEQSGAHFSLLLKAA